MVLTSFDFFIRFILFSNRNKFDILISNISRSFLKKKTLKKFGLPVQ